MKLAKLNIYSYRFICVVMSLLMLLMCIAYSIDLYFLKGAIMLLVAIGLAAMLLFKSPTFKIWFQLVALFVLALYILGSISKL